MRRVLNARTKKCLQLLFKLFKVNVSLSQMRLL